MAVAILIGIAFGVALERAGLGSARKLTGQFYGTDLTVFKVMFTAILTAMLGAFWLSRLGLLALGQVFVPETWLLPQLAGGLIFGIGFVVAGLCPGTSCVSAATGRGDGAMVVGGMFVGVLVTGLAFAPLRELYESTSRGALTLPDALHVPYGVVVLGVVISALTGFVIAERIERRANCHPERESRDLGGRGALHVQQCVDGAPPSQVPRLDASNDTLREVAPHPNPLPTAMNPPRREGTVVPVPSPLVRGEGARRADEGLSSPQSWRSRHSDARDDRGGA